jgi:hypothetical protein
VDPLSETRPADPFRFIDHTESRADLAAIEAICSRRLVLLLHERCSACQFEG